LPVLRLTLATMLVQKVKLLILSVLLVHIRVELVQMHAHRVLLVHIKRYLVRLLATMYPQVTSLLTVWLIPMAQILLLLPTQTLSIHVMQDTTSSMLETLVVLFALLAQSVRTRPPQVLENAS
jgi:hypothetical protein